METLLSIVGAVFMTLGGFGVLVSLLLTPKLVLAWRRAMRYDRAFSGSIGDGQVGTLVRVSGTLQADAGNEHLTPLSRQQAAHWRLDWFGPQIVGSDGPDHNILTSTAFPSIVTADGEHIRVRELPFFTLSLKPYAGHVTEEGRSYLIAFMESEGYTLNPAEVSGVQERHVPSGVPAFALGVLNRDEQGFYLSAPPEDPSAPVSAPKASMLGIEECRRLLLIALGCLLGGVGCVVLGLRLY
jgi:hypothetical protein